MKLLVVRIGILKPGTREAQVEVNGVRSRELVVHAVEQVLLITLGVHYSKLRRIKKPARVQAARGNEIPPLLPSVTKFETAAG